MLRVSKTSVMRIPVVPGGDPSVAYDDDLYQRGVRDAVLVGFVVDNMLDQHGAD